ncbi:MAG: hypothetical protein FWD70_03735 [Desulfuromonadales bacterium]|nr:hypothetical protein [Desulfuromonadales bacterium]
MKKRISFFTAVVTLLLGSSFVFAAPQKPAVNSNLQAVPISATDSPALREAAADRYFQTIPIQSVMDDIQANINTLPEGARERAREIVAKALTKDVIEKIRKQNLVNTFTAEEIDAMTKFNLTPVGASVQQKMGTYLRGMQLDFQSAILKAGRL